MEHLQRQKLLGLGLLVLGLLLLGRTFAKPNSMLMLNPRPLAAPIAPIPPIPPLPPLAPMAPIPPIPPAPPMPPAAPEPPLDLRPESSWMMWFNLTMLGATLLLMLLWRRPPAQRLEFRK